MMMRRRRPLMRAAMVGGVAYHAGKKSQQGREEEAYQNQQIEDLQQQQQQQQYAPPPPQAPPPPAPNQGISPDAMEQLKQAQEKERDNGSSVIRELLRLGFTTEDNLTEFLAKQFGIEKIELDPNAIEDAAFLLVSAIADQGFLKPTIEIEFESPDGTKEKFAFDATLATPLPRPLTAKAVTFHVAEGTRYVVEDVQIDGLTAVPLKTAREYLRPDKGLFGGGEAFLGLLRQANREHGVDLLAARQCDELGRFAGLGVDEIEHDLRVIVAGDDSGGAGGRWVVTRFNADGTLDTSFGTGGWGFEDFGTRYPGYTSAVTSVAMQGNNIFISSCFHDLYTGQRFLQLGY